MEKGSEVMRVALMRFIGATLPGGIDSATPPDWKKLGQLFQLSAPDHVHVYPSLMAKALHPSLPLSLQDKISGESCASTTHCSILNSQPFYVVGIQLHNVNQLSRCEDAA